MSKENIKHGFIDQGKHRKRSSKRKWIDRKYHFQDNSNFSHKDVKMYCDTNEFPALPFCGPHTKPHESRGLSKHYRLSFDPKLVHGIFVILHIPCVFVACTSMLDKPWIYAILSKKQSRYQPVANCNC